MNKEGEPTTKTSQWEKELERERLQKDRFFREHPQSPLSPEARRRFRALNYFPPASNFRFELSPREHQQKERLKMTYTRGEEVEFLRWAEFRFKVGGRDCVLQAYKRDPEQEELFIPFRDLTSGEESYPAGRYLDLQPQEHYTKQGNWILDFNRAYNPWCAYSQAYTCPLVPPENWLKVRITAGEESFSPR
jgi:uncharacterized protein (DUF1684 family)